MIVINLIMINNNDLHNNILYKKDKIRLVAYVINSWQDGVNFFQFTNYYLEYCN